MVRIYLRKRILRQFTLFVYFFIFTNANLISASDFSRPNVILITIDSLRPDHLGCYGYKRNTSPNIDRLAREGILFNNVIVECPWTLPSLSSLFTSTYPHSHSVLNWCKEINPSFDTLPNILKNNGYYTGAILDLLLLEQCPLPFRAGFDEFQQGYYHKADYISKRAVSWLRRNQNKKFFLWIHYFDTHTPYRIPLFYKNIFIRDKYYGIKEIPLGKISAAPRSGGWGEIPKYTHENNIKNIYYYIAQYDGAIHFVDMQIGILLKEIFELGLDKNTVVIITADHGESLGEHNWYFKHGSALYDEQIKVPLIIWYRDFPQDKIVYEQSQFIDISPTITDLLGIQISKQREGKSLLSLIYGTGNNSLSYAFSELPWTIAIRTNEWKLIYNIEDKSYELYDLKNDPKELNNLAIQGGKIFENLKEKLDLWVKEYADRLTQDVHLETISDKNKHRLKSLGYLQ